MYNIIINLYNTTYSICNLLRPFNVQKLVYLSRSLVGLVLSLRQLKN